MMVRVDLMNGAGAGGDLQGYSYGITGMVIDNFRSHTFVGLWEKSSNDKLLVGKLGTLI
jgi:hypothetical protein